MMIKALIAVRSGSTRVLNKNLRPFAGSNLLTLKIKQLQQVENLDGIVVNSNDDAMLEIARSLGCEVVKRDQHYASNEVSMSDVYQNMAEQFQGDVVVYANCTNPLLKTKTIQQAIDFYKDNHRFYDSINSAHEVKEFLFKDNQPVNYQLEAQPRSQDLPDYYALNFAFNILSRETMMETKNVVSLNPCIYPISQLEGTDIDNPIDFEFAEFVFQKGYLLDNQSESHRF